eukprot:CAMPEP_0183361562 /NCGR_PEP_ID=MMETSP0164_2-20130417/62173_1 /TAXON_ID=221442 /ORGANISM="Coccolithus pelagicus ssp braarudi, Strain PLY182g" /LENGTH=284 /DNA_ID=CAMNT_0025536187 /DNA_START=64 /DNA_END=915 /DNA_ORIENTATION=-
MLAVGAANKRGRAAGVAAVAAAKRRGSVLINRGAGTMPVDAPAPHGGVRYNLLSDPPEAQEPRWRPTPHDGTKDADGCLAFADAPNFRPNLTPAECIRKGIFGGCYFNPRGGKAGIFASEVAIDHSEFPAAWFTGISQEFYISRRYNVPTNAYKVKSGFGQKEWESKGWMHVQDPRGWFQWYCRFFCGRRSADDAAADWALVRMRQSTRTLAQSAVWRGGEGLRKVERPQCQPSDQADAAALGLRAQRGRLRTLAALQSQVGAVVPMQRLRNTYPHGNCALAAA